MATATAKKAPAKKAAPKVVEPVEEVEEGTDDELELEELEEDTVEETPAKGSKTAKAKKESPAKPTVTFGASDLARWITENIEGAKVDARGIRTLIRKMARDGSGRVNREIVPGNRTRYDWSGPEDPEVKKIIEAFTSGELEADKKEKLDALKANKAAKDAAAKEVVEAAPKKSAGKKAKPAPVVVEEEADEELSLEDDDDEE